MREKKWCEVGGWRRGSHGLSARRAWRTKSSRPKGPKAGPKGRQLEVGPRRGPRLLVYSYFFKSYFFGILPPLKVLTLIGEKPFFNGQSHKKVGPKSSRDQLSCGQRLLWDTDSSSQRNVMGLRKSWHILATFRSPEIQNKREINGQLDKRLAQRTVKGKSDSWTSMSQVIFGMVNCCDM